MTLYRVKAWDDLFESAKSRTYGTKSQCYMPNKFGAGYWRMVGPGDYENHARELQGPAIYGAWCALVCLLSRKEGPRDGYLTDTGRKDGEPMSAEDIAVQVGMHPGVISAMLQKAASKNVGWLEVIQAKDTELSPPRLPDGPPPKPLPSPTQTNPSPLSLSPPSVGQTGGIQAERESETHEIPADLAGQVRYIRAGRDDWNLREADVAAEIRAMPEGPARTEVVRQFTADASNGDRPKNPIGMLRGYISRANAPDAPRPAGRVFPTQRKRALEDMLKPLMAKSYPTDAEAKERSRLQKELQEVNREIAGG